MAPCGSGNRLNTVLIGYDLKAFLKKKKSKKRVYLVLRVSHGINTVKWLRQNRDLCFSSLQLHTFNQARGEVILKSGTQIYVIDMLRKGIDLELCLPGLSRLFSKSAEQLRSKYIFWPSLELLNVSEPNINRIYNRRETRQPWDAPMIDTKSVRLIINEQFGIRLKKPDGSTHPCCFRISGFKKYFNNQMCDDGFVLEGIDINDGFLGWP